jgi:group I intron endonuclease
MTNRINNIGIYKITNVGNNRIYIGSTKNIRNRKYRHFSQLRNNKHFNQFLQNDYNKCNFEKFKFEVVLYCDEFNLTFYEQKFLDKYFDAQTQCYNMSKYVQTSMRDRKHSQETKDKISKAGIGRVFSEEHKNRMSESGKGRTCSDEHKHKISDAKKGTIVSQETRNKLSESRKGIILSQETKNKIGASNKGKTISEKTRNKMSESGKVKIFSKEHRENISKANKGKKMSQENKDKLIKANMGRIHSQETKDKISKVHQKSIKSINLINGEEMIFPSIKIAACYYNIPKCSISKNLRGKCKTCKNKTLRFEYYKLNLNTDVSSNL